MSKFQSFFISAAGDNHCEDLNSFLQSHSIIRTIENTISTSNIAGIQILVEYKDSGNSQNEKTKRVDYRSLLKSEREKQIFDRLKEFRSTLAKEKKLVGAYMVCKDEHLYKIVQNPIITIEEISQLPHSGNIFIKDFAKDLFDAYQQILLTVEEKITNKDETDSITF